MKFLFYVFALLLVCNNVFATPRGSEGTGGGNQCKLLVEATLKKISSITGEFDSLYKVGIKVEDFRNLTKEVTITAEPRLYRMDEYGHLEKVDAINYPALKKIEFDDDRCIEIAKLEEAFTAFIVHELLGLKRINDIRNIVSKEFYHELQGQISTEAWVEKSIWNGTQIRLQAIHLSGKGAEDTFKHMNAVRTVEFKDDNGNSITEKDGTGITCKRVQFAATGRIDQYCKLYVTAAGKVFGSNDEDSPFNPGSGR